MVTRRIAHSSQRTSRRTRVASLVASLVVGTLAASGSAAAFEITYAQRLACTPDAFRLCSEHIPDAAAVRACMLSKKSQLSDSCRAMFKDASAAH